MAQQGHMNARATATSVITAGAASMMLAVAVPAAAEPPVAPAHSPSFVTAPADCATDGSQTGSGSNPSLTQGAQSGIDAVPSPSPGECANIGPGGPAYNGTDPRGKN
jgi:hypothetical protein